MSNLLAATFEIAPPPRVLLPVEQRASDARRDALAVADRIADATEFCTCGQYDRDGEIGCPVPHDTLAAELEDAIEHYVACALDASLADRGELIADFRTTLLRAHRHVAWDEILPQGMVEDAFEFAKRRMETHGVPARAAA